MKHLRVLRFLAAALIAVPTAASAGLAYSTKDINLRAGPATEYPVVARLRANAALDVMGCVDGYRWCDVASGPYRGWVYGGNILYPYQGKRVPVLNYGSLLGIGIVGFLIGSYWDDHYRGRPWYHQRQYWVDRPAHWPGPGAHRPPPRPPAFRPDGHRPVRPPVADVRPGGHRPAVPPGPAARPPQPRPPSPAVRPEGHRPQPPQGGNRPQGQPQGHRGNQDRWGGEQRGPRDRGPGTR